MMHDQGPKDGDFARYVEGLSLSSVASNAAAAKNTSNADPIDLSDFSNGQPQSPQQTPTEKARSDQVAATAAGQTESPPSASTKTTIAGMVRAIVIGLIALIMIAPLVPEPFDVLVRIAAIIYVVYIFKRSQPALALLRNKLAELKKQQH